jgi:hypothetical protein
MSSMHRIALLSSLIILLVGCATNLPQPPTEWDGLEYRPGNETGAVYMRPDVEFKTYRTVMIDPPVVVIDSHWNPVVGGIPVGQGVAPRQLSSGEVQQIKDTIAGEFWKILVKEMTAGGYQVLERPGDDTVRVTPVLINVYTDGTSGGRMTLVMELRDAPTGQLLGRLVDEKTGPMGLLQFPDSVTENVIFRRAVQTWGRWLRAGVDKMSGQSPKT